MRKNKHAEYRQAYNTQAAADADGSMLVLSAYVTNCASGRNELLLVTLACNCKRLHKLKLLHRLNIAARFPLLCNLRNLSPTDC